MFRGIRRMASRGLQMNALGMQANALGSALQGRMGQGGAMGYMDDSLPAQSAVDGMTLQSVIKQRRQQQRPTGTMSGMGFLQEKK